jgi:hypothetical protein
MFFRLCCVSTKNLNDFKTGWKLGIQKILKLKTKFS